MKKRWRYSGRSPWTPDSPEWTDEDWERARPALEFDPELGVVPARTREAESTD